MSRAANTHEPPTIDRRARHPRGLYLLFGTEMWERMSFYGMRALLALYMADRARGGFGWDKRTTLSVYGWYIGLVYLTPLLGGYLADRYLGQRRAVTIGGLLMMFGHFMMAVPGIAAFYSALALLILGNGFFKPNISTMVGGLYAPSDPRRDGAFTIFYMGINLGALLGTQISGTLGEKVGWHWGFGSAGVGMGIGLVLFLVFANRLLGPIGKEPSRAAEEHAPAQASSDEEELSSKQTTDRIMVIGILAIFVIFFWASFEQAGGLMNLYTDEKVNRTVLGFEIPTTWFQSVNPVLILALGPLFANLWSFLGRKGKDPSIPAKMGYGLLLLSFGFVLMVFASRDSAAHGKANVLWLIGAYLFHTMGELCLSPVGLSMVTKLAPKRLASLLMGAWFLSNAIANKLSGVIGGYAQDLGELPLFVAIVVATALAGMVLLAIAPILRRMMHGADRVTAAPEPTSTEGGEPTTA